MTTQAERRQSARIPLIRSCAYEFSTVHGAETVDMSEGQAFSVNVSQHGMLLLMPQEPERTQVLEVQAPSTTGEQTTLKVAEVCWTSKVKADDEGAMHLVGVKYLFEPPAR